MFVLNFLKYTKIQTHKILPISFSFKTIHKSCPTHFRLLLFTLKSIANYPTGKHMLSCHFRLFYYIFDLIYLLFTSYWIKWNFWLTNQSSCLPDFTLQFIEVSIATVNELKSILGRTLFSTIIVHPLNRSFNRRVASEEDLLFIDILI